MAGGIKARKFNGENYRLIQSFPTKAMAQSYARGLRRRGLPMNPNVKVRITKARNGYAVWVRGK